MSQKEKQVALKSNITALPSTEAKVKVKVAIWWLTTK